MKLIVFINTPEIRVDIQPVDLEHDTLEEFFEHVRGKVRDALSDPRSFRIPADQILRIADMWKAASNRSA